MLILKKTIGKGDDTMKYITRDNLCYYKKNGIVYSRMATPSEVLSRSEHRFQQLMEME